MPSSPSEHGVADAGRPNRFKDDRYDAAAIQTKFGPRLAGRPVLPAVRGVALRRADSLLDIQQLQHSGLHVIDPRDHSGQLHDLRC